MTETCKFCNTQTEVTPIVGTRDVFAIRCPLCGEYDITDSARWSSLEPDLSPAEKALFSSYLRNRFTQNDILRIDSNTLRDIKHLIEPFKAMTFDEKIDAIIQFLGTETRQIGNPVNMVNTFPLFYLRNQEELTSLLSMMEKMGVGKLHHATGYILEAKGWQRYDAVKTRRIDSKQAFVAMSFNPGLSNIFTEAISPACQECDFVAMRVDRSEHNEKICDRIIAEIKRSKFLIADFSDPRYGVYFEAGFAHGLGIPVIWTCKKDDVERLHFDTRQYNHIVWETTAELKEKLMNRIRATIK